MQDDNVMVVLTAMCKLNEGEGPNQLVAIRPEHVEFVSEGEPSKGYGCTVYMRSGKSMVVMDTMPEVLELINQEGVATDVLNVRKEFATP